MKPKGPKRTSGPKRPDKIQSYWAGYVKELEQENMALRTIIVDMAEKMAKAVELAEPFFLKDKK
jgi:hypothetical protein